MQKDCMPELYLPSDYGRVTRLLDDFALRLVNMARKHSNVEELTWSLLSFFERRTDLFHVMETSTDRGIPSEDQMTSDK